MSCCFANALLPWASMFGLPLSNEHNLGAQELDRLDGKQARLQLEDMLTRIELHFQVLRYQKSPAKPPQAEHTSEFALGPQRLIPVKCFIMRLDRIVSPLECLLYEVDLQAEKSARLEAEARCAAALETLRRAGHPHSMPLLPPAHRQLPEDVIERAREGITAACSLVASVSSVLEGQPELPML